MHVLMSNIGNTTWKQLSRGEDPNLKTLFCYFAR